MINKSNLIKINISFCFSIAIFLLTQSHSYGQNGVTKEGINKEYLACYALEPESKKQCTEKLAQRYIDNSKQQDKDYIQQFQFESERLGFKEFLNKLGVPCKAINDGPIFIQKTQAYLVTCQPQGQYFMKFDCTAQEWQLIQEE